MCLVNSGAIQIMGPPKSFRNNQAVGDAIAHAQTSGGIAAVVVAVIGRPLPTVSGNIFFF